MSNNYWVGVRESDLLGLDGMYEGSITFFGSGKNGNRCLFQNETSRKDHNVSDPQFDIFYTQMMQEVLEEDSSARFMFYNQDMVYHIEAFLRRQIICYNQLELLQSLNNKMLCKLWLKEVVFLLPTLQIFGAELTFSFLRSWFSNCEAFVIQPDYSSGGHSTYLLTEENESHVLKQLNLAVLYSVSPYMKDAIPVNIHGVAYQNGFQLYPPSIQIIQQEQNQLIYAGGDFIAAQMLSDNEQERIYSTAKTISEKLLNIGYLGVYGIDLIVQEGSTYFLEVNPRFQASTPVLNYVLQKQGHISINQCCIDAFAGRHMDGTWCDMLDLNVNYSILSYTASTAGAPFFQHIWKKYFPANPQFSLLADGYRAGAPAETGAYLFRAIYSHNLVNLSLGHLRSAEPLISAPYVQPDSPMRLKAMLITYGLTISEEALAWIEQRGAIREANFSAIDITVEVQEHPLIVNCPYRIWPSEYSPFDLRLLDGDLTLFFFETPISVVSICNESPLNQEKTASGVHYSSVAFLATDRLRINYRPVCYFKRIGKGCAFCNLPKQNQDYGQADIQEIIDTYLRREKFRHILIGGGSADPDNCFQEVIQLTRFLRERTSKPLYLMSLPPRDLSCVKALYEAGISEMAFNIEIFDRALASQYMPGKGTIPLERYISALTEAVYLMGRQGNVRSMLLVGFDSKGTLLEGVKKLCEIGVQPMLSVFRPMPGTPLEKMLPPRLQDTLEIFNRASDICRQYGLTLGPSCSDCQNNTLSLPDWFSTSTS